MCKKTKISKCSARLKLLSPGWVLFPVRSFDWAKCRCYLPEVQPADTSAAHTWPAHPSCVAPGLPGDTRWSRGTKGTSAHRDAAASKPPGSPQLVTEPQPSHSITLSSIQQSLHQRNLTWETDQKFSLARRTRSCPAPVHKAHKSPLSSSVSL